jgi:hypothetical protein
MVRKREGEKSQSMIKLKTPLSRTLKSRPVIDTFQTWLAPIRFRIVEKRSRDSVRLSDTDLARKASMTGWNASGMRHPELL